MIIKRPLSLRQREGGYVISLYKLNNDIYGCMINGAFKISLMHKATDHRGQGKWKLNANSPICLKFLPSQVLKFIHIMVMWPSINLYINLATTYHYIANIAISYQKQNKKFKWKKKLTYTSTITVRLWNWLISLEVVHLVPWRAAGAVPCQAALA